MNDLQELVKQYKLSKTGDKNAIRCILSNMGDGKFLKSDLPFELNCLLELAEQSEESAYKTLYTLKEVDPENEPLYFEPDYIKEEKKLAEEAQILAEAKAWKENLLAKKAAEEKARLKAEEEARQAELHRIEEEKKKEAKRLARIEAEEKERQLLEQKELEIVEHLKATATETLHKIVQDMVFIEGGNALLGNINYDSNPPHMETVESFWIKKHPITTDETEKLLINYYVRVSDINISKYVQRLSKIMECNFDIPTSTQLEYAMRAKDKNYVPGNKTYRIIGDDRLIDYNGNSRELVKDGTIVVENYSEPCISRENCIANAFRIVCSDAKFRDIMANYSKMEEERSAAIEKEKQEKKLKELERVAKKREEKKAKRIELWLSVIEKYLNTTELFEYEEGILFIKKKLRVRYTKEPLTWRVWNAIMEKDFLDVWEAKEQKAIKASQEEKNKKTQGIDELMNRYHLDNFLKKINDYMAGKKTFEYVHDNKNLEKTLLKEGKIRYGVYLYTKED